MESLLVREGVRLSLKFPVFETASPENTSWQIRNLQVCLTIVIATSVRSAVAVIVKVTVKDPEVVPVFGRERKILWTKS